MFAKIFHLDVTKIFCRKSSLSGWIESHSELFGVIVSDITITPNVEMLLLGFLHSVIILLDHFSEFPSSFLVNKEQAVFDQSFANVIVSFMNSYENIISSPRINALNDKFDLTK